MTALFLAVGHNGLRLTSPDGKTWSAPAVGKEGETYRAAAGGNGRLVAVGSFGGSNLFAATADGTAWATATRDAQYSRYVRGLGFGDGTFLAVGGDPGSVGLARPFTLLSPDGAKWEGPFEDAGKFLIRRVAFGNGVWVGVGDRGRRAASKDAKAWADVPGKPVATDTLIDVAFGNGVFVGVGLHGLRAATADGKTWAAPARGDEGEHLNSVVWAKDRFVAVGAGVTFTSPDGVKWERHPTTNAPLSAAYGNGVFVGPRWKGRLVRSADAVAWEETHRAEHHVEAVAFGHVG